MAYSELIKNFNKVRDYMRDFYVYGFKSRDEYTKKSARSYDDEKRRIESWLGEYMQFRQTAEGKNVFISIDSRSTRHNPLYKAWKTKSFTDGDITLHFLIFDILQPGVELTLVEIAGKIDEYLQEFDDARTFDTSTIRKKLNEYINEGMIESTKVGKALVYSRANDSKIPDIDVLNFFSETAPCGVIGSYLLDKVDDSTDNFGFKHHYITGAVDSEILEQIFDVIRQKRSVTIENTNKWKTKSFENHIVPLRVMFSVQSGRQYVMAYVPAINRIKAFRLDLIISAQMGNEVENYDELRSKLEKMKSHMWGVSTENFTGKRMEHVEFTIHYETGESHIPQRLEREKRIGTVEYLDENTCKFSADVFDTSEMVPWIRTFICRITDINMSNKKLEKIFRDDIQSMYDMYGIGGDNNVI